MHSILWWTFRWNDLSDSLEIPASLFADYFTLCCIISHASDRQAAASPLSADLDGIRSWSNTSNMSFNPDKSTPSFRKDRLANPPMYFLNEPLEEVKSLKLLGFTINHNLSLAGHISKIVFKASSRLGMSCHVRSFLGRHELLTTYRAFIQIARHWWKASSE